MVSQPAVDLAPRNRADLAALAGLAERVRPVEQPSLPVLPPLEGLLPGGLARGSVVAVGAVPGVAGATTLALAVAAGPSRAGAWVALVGVAAPLGPGGAGGRPVGDGEAPPGRRADARAGVGAHSDRTVAGVRSDRRADARSEHAVAGTRSDRTGAAPARSGVGAHSDRTGAGADSEHSVAGARSDHTGVGARSDRSVAGARSDRSATSAGSDHTGAGVDSDRSGAGAGSDRRVAGTRSDHTGVGARSDRSATSAGSEHAGAGVGSDRSGAGARFERAGAGRGAGASGFWGLLAAAGLGVALERLVVVAPPERPAVGWGALVATLVDGFPVVVLGAQVQLRAGDNRRLAARLRERGGVLIRVGGGGGGLPMSAHVRLLVTEGRWEGVIAGAGHLRARRVVVEATGRGAASRLRRSELLLPGPGGEVALAPSTPEDMGAGGRHLSPQACADSA